LVKNVKWEITEDLAQKLLREVPQYNAFYFFTGINNYCGTYANSLLVFLNKLKTIDKASVDFHFKRRDFENWIRSTIGDANLANEIAKINESVDGDELLEQICKIIEKRLKELKQLLASEEPYVEHDDDL
jgi:hypothetical protein